VQKQINARANPSHLSNDEAATEFLNEKQTTHRFASIGDIAALTLFLCLPAASNITGASHPVDPGWKA
jgi:3-hydroxybutyrate dehydrogenase